MTLVAYKCGDHTETYQVCDCGDQYLVVTHTPLPEFVSNILEVVDRRKAERELERLIEEVERHGRSGDDGADLH
jgi:hypothetical protein